MKAIRIITNPIIVLISFLLILISGEHWGGFYILYLILALPHGGTHALLGLVGIIALSLAMYARYHRRDGNDLRTSSLISLGGVLFMAGSLLSFFMQKGGEYNYQTFTQIVPLLSLIIFIVLACCFFIQNLFVLVNPRI